MMTMISIFLVQMTLVAYAGIINTQFSHLLFRRRKKQLPRSVKQKQWQLTKQRKRKVQ